MATFMKCRFHFGLITFAYIGLAAAIPLRAEAQTNATDSRPNILFCLADDQSWPHAGVYGDKTIHTPTQDRVARNGVRFNYCFSTSPSCTASRAAILTGQYPHRLKEGADLWGTLDKTFPVYPDLLDRAGYVVGFTRKGWGPGDFKPGGRVRNPAGPEFKDFASFLATVPAGKPFCFWFGSHQPHRPYEKGLGTKVGLGPESVEVPPIWPDVPEVRSDILDYYAEVQRFDGDVGHILDRLEKAGRLSNTLVVLSGDNGWPFPRAKANLYDAGTRQPLIIQWPARIKPGGVCDDFINLMDLAPTFLEAAGINPPPEMTGRSFMKLLEGTEPAGSRNEVFFERERHANVRKGDLGYPMRAVRTRDFLYIRNFYPDRWPAGDPEKWKAVGPFGDVDPGPTKQYLLDHRNDPDVARLFQLAFGKRPAEELYDVNLDPCQTNNLAAVPDRQQTLQQLRKRLLQWMKDTADPRTGRDDGRWDRAPYYGPGS